MGSLAAVCALSLIPAALHAQGDGSINGTVTDPSGAVVAGAEVTATQVSTGISTKTITSSQGTFVFPILATSTYTVTAMSQGFEAFRAAGVQLQADRRAACYGSW